MEARSLLNRLNSRATLVSFALLALAVVTLWSVRYVYGYELTKTVLSTHELADDVVLQTRVYHTYQDFSEDGVTSRYTYIYAKAVEDCFNSVRIALFDSAGEAAGANPDLEPPLCAPPTEEPSEETYYAGWNYRESIFNEIADFAEARAYMYQYEDGGGLSAGWRVFFHGNVSIEHECHQSYGQCSY